METTRGVIGPVLPSGRRAPPLMATIAPSRRALAFAVGCALAGSLASGESAHAQIAQEGFALDQLHPAPAGDRFFSIQGAEAEGHARLKLMLLAEYARDPLVMDDSAVIVLP